MDKLKIITTKILLIFVLVSIGFIFGKHSVKNKVNTPDELNILNNKNSYIAVYYLHSTFRCVTCNTIEKLTKKLLDTSYAQELKKGTIIWKEEDFQQNENLARKFEVIASCVVVAQVKDKEISDFVRLDEVWTKISDHNLFNEYIGNAIDGYLGKQEEKK